MYSTTECAERVQAEVRRHLDFRVLADVRDGAARDLAVAVRSDALAMLRCVGRPRSNDYATLATMIAAGDFAWAGLVYSDQPGSERSADVETFHVSDLPRLVDRLRALQRARAP